MEFYPSWRFHRTERAVIVADPASDEALGPGWADTPAAFFDPEPEEDAKDAANGADAAGPSDPLDAPAPVPAKRTRRR
jgi:hypothetical protein